MHEVTLSLYSITSVYQNLCLKQFLYSLDLAWLIARASPALSLNFNHTIIIIVSTTQLPSTNHSSFVEAAGININTVACTHQLTAIQNFIINSYAGLCNKVNSHTTCVGVRNIHLCRECKHRIRVKINIWTRLPIWSKLF